MIATDKTAATMNLLRMSLIIDAIDIPAWLPPCPMTSGTDNAHVISLGRLKSAKRDSSCAHEWLRIYPCTIYQCFEV